MGGGFRKVHGARVAAVRSREAPLRAALIRVLTRAAIGDE
ncbi:beta-lactamase class A [Burkholderia pseudomallei 668]|nr:beta-lactamase class A [Burkholderia pseudomallei 668]